MAGLGGVSTETSGILSRRECALAQSSLQAQP